MKVTLDNPYPLLLPLPAVMASCKRANEKSNIITIAWCGVVCSQPPAVSISIRDENRYSYDIIKETGEFVVNIPNNKLLEATDLCGCISGNNYDKFKEAGLEPQPTEHLHTPMIKEAPINLECRVMEKNNLENGVNIGSHDMFVGRVLEVHIKEELLTDGKLDMDKLDCFTYVPNASSYFKVDGELNSHSFSVK